MASNPLSSETVPPHNADIEKNILAACIHKPELFFVLKKHRVSKDYFFVVLDQAIYQAMDILSSDESFSTEVPFDTILIAHEVQKRLKNKSDELNDGTLASQVLEISSRVGTEYSFDKLLKELVDIYWKRRVFYFAIDLVDENYASEVDEIAMEFSEFATEIQQSKAAGREKTIRKSKDLVKSFISDFEEKYVNKSLPGYSTGLSEIDTLTGGLRKKQFWVIGGPTSSGKSALALQIAGACCLQNLNVGIISLEMSGEEIIGRMMSAMEGISYDIIYNPHKYTLTKDQLIALKNGTERFNNFQINVHDKGGVTMSTIEQVIAEMEQDKLIDVLVIDHMHLLTADQSENKRHLELSKISSICKAIAMKKQIPIIVPCQLNEDGKIRDSRAVADDPDVVMFIRYGHIWVEKNRNGMRFVELPLALVGNRMKFMTPMPV